MKIYTRTGDKGTTGLADGSRLSKSSVLIHAIGAIDEVNAVLGWLLCLVDEDHESRTLLMQTQNELFSCGAWLATLGKSALPSESMVSKYEVSIDAISQKLTPLERFILPGGCELAARAHIARVSTRRAERAIIDLAESESIDISILSLMNRLSDWLFVLARLYNAEAGVKEVTWENN